MMFEFNMAELLRHRWGRLRLHGRLNISPR